MRDFFRIYTLVLAALGVAYSGQLQANFETSPGVVKAKLIYDAPSQAYYTELKVGSQNYTFLSLIDTGSSDLWLSDSLFNYNESTTFVENSTEFEMEYATGQISGLWGSDHLVIGNSVIPKQVLGVGTSAPVDMSGVQSILGISYIQDESSQYITDGKFAYPNVPQSLVDNNYTARNVIGIYGSEDVGGELVFGGYDASQIVIDSLTRFINLPSGFYRDTNTPYYQGYYITVDEFEIFNSFDSLKLSTTKNYALIDSGASQFIVNSNYFNNIATAVNLFVDPDGNSWVDTSSDFQATYFNVTFTGKTFSFPFSTFIEFGNTSFINGTNYYLTNIVEMEDLGYEFVLGKDFFKSFYFIADMVSNELAIGYKKNETVDPNYIIATSNVAATTAAFYSSTFDITKSQVTGDVTVTRSLSGFDSQASQTNSFDYTDTEKMVVCRSKWSRK